MSYWVVAGQWMDDPTLLYIAGPYPHRKALSVAQTTSTGWRNVAILEVETLNLDRVRYIIDTLNCCISVGSPSWEASELICCNLPIETFRLSLPYIDPLWVDYWREAGEVVQQAIELMKERG